MEGETCLKCGGTGILASGELCDCGVKTTKLVLPPHMKVPLQYQSIQYNKMFIHRELQPTLGVFMEKLLNDITTDLYSYSKNYIICSPANTGKTVWAYNLYSLLYSKGENMPEILDLMQVREVLLNYFTDNLELLDKVNNAKIMVVRIPMDLPNKFVDTISTIVDRRVRNNCSTIFIYNGTRNDLYAQDRFCKLRFLEGDGSFNTLCIKSFEVRSNQ